MKGFYHIWAWRPSWSCDLDFLYTHWFPLPIDASYKIWLWLAKRFQRRRSLKLWTDDGRTPDHGHPISSPCEPNGSGELKKIAENFQFLRLKKSLFIAWDLEIISTQYQVHIQQFTTVLLCFMSLQVAKYWSMLFLCFSAF